jgi:hypothetical protein
MVSAFGEDLRFKDTYFNQRDMKDIGKILRKNADFIEFMFCLMPIRHTHQLAHVDFVLNETWERLSKDKNNQFIIVKVFKELYMFKVRTQAEHHTLYGKYRPTTLYRPNTILIAKS